MRSTFGIVKEKITLIYIYIVMIFGMLINNITVIRMTHNWKAAGIL